MNQYNEINLKDKISSADIVKLGPQSGSTFDGVIQCVFDLDGYGLPSNKLSVDTYFMETASAEDVLMECIYEAENMIQEYRDEQELGKGT